MASFDPGNHHRRSIRAKGFDYAQAGMYFVTICAQDRTCLFGEIGGEGMSLSVAGLMIESWWHAIPTRFPGTAIDAMVVMPNHIHGIVLIEALEDPSTSMADEQGRHIGLPLRNPARRVGADQCVCPVPNTQAPKSKPISLPRIVQWFKTMTTNDYLDGVRNHGLPPLRNRLWQRNYYEHIIRSDRDLDRIRAYIAANPSQWARDEENPTLAGR